MARRPTSGSRAVDPHPVHDDGQLAGERDLCRLPAATLGDPNRLGPQGRPAALVHQDMCRLIERGAHHLVARPADPAVVLGLPGAASPQRQAEMSHDVAQPEEAFRRIDTGPVGQRDDDPDAGDGHEPLADGVAYGELSKKSREREISTLGSDHGGTPTYGVGRS